VRTPVSSDQISTIATWQMFVGFDSLFEKFRSMLLIYTFRRSIANQAE